MAEKIFLLLACDLHLTVMRPLHFPLFTLCSAALAVSCAVPLTVRAQPSTPALPVPNYDEAKVGNLPIPDVLTAEDGSHISSVADWQTKRRPELLRLFEKEVYGKTPEGKSSDIHFTVTSEDKNALHGKATKREVRLFFGKGEAVHADVLVFLPNGLPHPAPVFVSLNFGGNQAVTDDATIKLSEGWFRNDAKKGYVNNRATEATRGSSAERWPVEEIIARGFGIATAYYGDFEPDHDGAAAEGVRSLYLNGGREIGAGDWGAIGAWAWGLSRIADYVVTLPEANAKKLIVLGHSRLGKTSLWAGAQDERFSVVISNDSGAGGAALSKRIFGETCANINHSFPHWMCGNFHKYSDNEAALPVDQHELIALMAPRAVYIASATEDLWADPKGEFLGGKLAEPIYHLFGKKGLECDAPPAADTSVGFSIGYHARTGKHNILLFDWRQYMNFAEKQWATP